MICILSNECFFFIYLSRFFPYLICILSNEWVPYKNLSLSYPQSLQWKGRHYLLGKYLFLGLIFIFRNKVAPGYLPGKKFSLADLHFSNEWSLSISLTRNVLYLIYILSNKWAPIYLPSRNLSLPDLHFLQWVVPHYHPGKNLSLLHHQHTACCWLSACH